MLVFSIRTESIKAVSLKDETDKFKILERMKEKGRERLCTDDNLDFLKGFCVPYTWGQFVHTSDLNTSSSASKLFKPCGTWARVWR